MKKTTVALTLLIIFFFFSCSKDRFSREERKFIKTYKEILVTRYSIQDSVQANKEVGKILKNNGFSFRDFLELSWKLKSKDPKKFEEMLDSSRRQAIHEILELRRKELHSPTKR